MKNPNIAKGKGDSLKGTPFGCSINGGHRKFCKNYGNRQLRHFGKKYLLGEDPDAQLVEAVDPGRWS